MDVMWSAERIREELTRLDEKTGLHGAEQRISFSNSKRYLGMFYARAPMEFRFSNYWFQNTDWPMDAAIDVIRHEYAHYMDYELYGNIGHGGTWKVCCSRVGALPMRLYTEMIDKYYHRLNDSRTEINLRCDQYTVGQVIEHPKFGIGIIKTIEGTGTNRCVEVKFSNSVSKRLLLKWVDENCRRDDI